MSGEYGSGWEGESHAWLETQEGLVIDITGDQYKDKQLRFIDAVYVGTRENGFHNKFKLYEPVCYSKVIDPLVEYSEFDLRYKAVLGHLHEQ